MKFESECTLFQHLGDLAAAGNGTWKLAPFMQPFTASTDGFVTIAFLPTKGNGKAVDKMIKIRFEPDQAIEQTTLFVRQVRHASPFAKDFAAPSATSADMFRRRFFLKL